MDPKDVVFTTTMADRNIKITLFEGTPGTFGRQHIIHQRPFMDTKIDAVKIAVEKPDICYWDEDHRDTDKEKVYCLGADKEMPHMYMKVIVEYTSEYEGKIITAWPVKRIAPSEGDMTYVKHKK